MATISATTSHRVDLRESRRAAFESQRRRASSPQRLHPPDVCHAGDAFEIDHDGKLQALDLAALGLAFVVGAKVAVDDPPLATWGLIQIKVTLPIPCLTTIDATMMLQ